MDARITFNEVRLMDDKVNSKSNPLNSFRPKAPANEIEQDLPATPSIFS